MKQSTISVINELVFMEPKYVFSNPDVILYHPGHFPELNEQFVEYYKQSGAEVIMIPSVHNPFLNKSEYEYYVPLLIDAGIEPHKLVPIPVSQEQNGVAEVIRAAFSMLNGNDEYRQILLAGKSFFCRRFYLLASIFANDDKVLDILPLKDKRNILPNSWMESEVGQERVMNEIEKYGSIVNALKTKA